jgi:AcrR family transcriptional regulator
MVPPSGSRAKTAARKRRGRGSLSSEEILDAAQQLVEKHGLHQLSMPRLAEQLASGVTSIYWYFHSKDDLIVALAERVGREMHARLPPVSEGPWDQQIIEYFDAYRALMHRSPVYREVFAYREQPLFVGSTLSRSLLARLEAGILILVDAGLTPEQAAEAYFACNNYTNAFILREHGHVNEASGLQSDLLATRDLRDVPTLAQIADPDVLIGVGDTQFRSGLQLLLDGIAKQYPVLESAKKRRPPKS